MAQSSTKRNRHPACSCDACRRGSSSDAGQATHLRVNRQIRRIDRVNLAQIVKSGAFEDLEDFEDAIVSTPYTD